MRAVGKNGCQKKGTVMKEKKYHLYLDETEHRLIIDFRNKLIAEGRYTDCVDELLVKLSHAKKVKMEIR